VTNGYVLGQQPWLLLNFFTTTGSLAGISKLYPDLTNNQEIIAITIHNFTLPPLPFMFQNDSFHFENYTIVPSATSTHLARPSMINS
jgi:hypothetical protein